MSKLIIALLGIGWLVLFAVGVRDDADNFFTPAQVLAGETHKNIPFWIGGTPAEVEAQLAAAGLQAMQVRAVSDRHLLISGINASQ